jgi:aspartate 4-decarboxylase
MSWRNLMKKAELSPFELKNKLIDIATSHRDRMMLNAGRGNPNFLATTPRHAFLKLGEFALIEAERSYAYLHSGFGGIPEKTAMAERFDNFLADNKGKEGIELLQSSLSFVTDHLGVSRQAFLNELVEAFLGCNYPVPPRMLRLCEQIVKLYIGLEICGTTTNSDNFDLFATEGGTAAMTYFFHSLKTNGLLKEGDKIAMMTPIFSPYLEIPQIPEFDLESVYIRADEKLAWQFSDKELKKLEDKSIKLLCMVNPSNPPSVKMNETSLAALAELVKTKRPDLMIVTDDVYATFSNDFKSVFATCPYNTLCVYSFSKYFGATGWRLGVIALHKDNLFDDLIAKSSNDCKIRLEKRYESLTDDVASLKFIDRLVADSRTVALNHTSGISLPQQLQMTLFALSSLVDDEKQYNKAAKRLIRRRYDILYRAMGISPYFDGNSVDYYALIDLELLAEKAHGKAFSAWLLKTLSGYDFLTRLANETGVVLLPGKGFEFEHPSVRVSLANLEEFKYRAIGLSVKKLLDEYLIQFQDK